MVLKELNDSGLLYDLGTTTLEESDSSKSGNRVKKMDKGNL